MSLCASRGFGIELQNYALPEFEPDIDAQITQLEEIEVRAIHAPFFDLCPGSLDPLVQQVTAQRFRKTISHARALRCEHIIFHNGFNPLHHMPDGWATRAIEFWSELLNQEGTNLKFYIENTLESDPLLLLEVLDGVGISNLKINLDVGHAHAFSKWTVLEWIEYLQGAIGYAHLHNNYGNEDEHLPLRDGSLSMKEVCHALDEYAPNALWAIEMHSKTHALDSIEWLEENGFIFK